MAHLLAPQLKEFYEEGILNILNMMPSNLSDEEHLAIESIVYIAYGYYVTYLELESILAECTSVEGKMEDDSHKFKRNSFNLAWSMIDSAYALSCILKLPVSKKFINPSPELLDHLSQASIIRNYMDHISNNFGNFLRIKQSAPLFGWFSFQFSPSLVDLSISKKFFFLLVVGSTFHKEGAKINSTSCSSQNVLSAIDNICIHARRTDKCNLSRMFLEMTRTLNEFSIKTQSYLIELLNSDNFDHGGLKIPFPSFTLRADSNDDLIFEEILTEINFNKVRTVVKLTDTQASESKP